MSGNTSSLGHALPPRFYRLFLASTYLTLILACACLTYAEWTLLPEAAVLAGLVAVMLGAAWWAEGKWSLSTAWANLLGAAIATATLFWVGVRWVQPSGGLLRTVPWPSSLLPVLGPMVMVLVPAKLFRPKQVADFWGLQGMGLVCVGLACALADDLFFGGLLLLYLASGVWCLALFLTYRERLMGAVAERPPAVPRLRQVLGWALPILVVALMVFLFTPRSGETWHIAAATRQRAEVGMPEEPVIDLNHTGTLELNRDVVFEVYVEDSAGRPKLDLRSDQRWRGQTFKYYYDGRWWHVPRSDNPGLNTARVPAPQAAPTANVSGLELPNFGAEQYVLTFTILAKNLNTPFVSDPVFLHPSGTIPVVTLRDPGRLPWLMTYEGLFAPVHPLPRDKGHYSQMTIPARDPQLGPAVRGEQGIRTSLMDPPKTLPQLHPWTMQLLHRIAPNNKQIGAAVADLREDGTFWPRYHETIARALEAHLASSREYKYSLELSRANLDIDPVEDFLYNTKSGHCNRFATALAVMLRSLHIPTRIVLGFRGLDPHGDGYYDVRQFHAHSWVEVFVSRHDSPPPHGRDLGELGPLTWHWLALDPTPYDDAMDASEQAKGRWWNSSSWNSEQLFKDLILNYSPERRDQAAQLFWETAQAAWNALLKALTASGDAGLRARTAATLTLTSFGLALFLTGRGLWRRIFGRRKRAKAPLAAATAFHRRLLAVLARCGWKPAPAQTAAEFAASVAPKLHDRPRGAELADFVQQTTSLFYRVRFGGRPLALAESRQIDDGLRRLANALSGNGN